MSGKHPDRCGPGGVCPDGTACYEGFCIHEGEATGVAAPDGASTWDEDASVRLDGGVGPRPSVDAGPSRSDASTREPSDAQSGEEQPSEPVPTDGAEGTDGTPVPPPEPEPPDAEPTPPPDPDPAPGTGPIGSTCGADGDCSGGVCLATDDGGYCSAACGAAECPANSVCKPLEDQSYCLLVCRRHDDCPSGSKCVGVPRNNVKACEPRP